MIRKILVATLRFRAALTAVLVMLLGAGDGVAQTPKPGGTLNVGLHIDLLHYDWQSTVAHPFPHVMGHAGAG
jgi:hypothetical protein